MIKHLNDTQPFGGKINQANGWIRYKLDSPLCTWGYFHCFAIKAIFAKEIRKSLSACERRWNFLTKISFNIHIDFYEWIKFICQLAMLTKSSRYCMATASVFNQTQSHGNIFDYHVYLDICDVLNQDLCIWLTGNGKEYYSNCNANDCNLLECLFRLVKM